MTEGIQSSAQSSQEAPSTPSGGSHRQSGRRRLAAVLGGGLLGVVFILAAGDAWNASPTGGIGSASSPAEFIDDRACAECHRAEHDRWAKSHHAKAMQPAEQGTVLGSFNGVTFRDRGLTARFFRRDQRFFVSTEGADGTNADFEITYTLGVEPLQQYLVQFPAGRLQALTIAWDTRQKRWFSLYPNVKFALDDPRRWTGRYQNWNLMCAECHTTNLRKGYNAANDSYQTVWDASNVGCQACHGPGQAHVAWARGPRGGVGTRPADVELLVDFTTTASRDQVDNCARCHSRRVRLAESERPGHPLLDNFLPELLQAGLYHANGQQLGEVYEYGSFRLSRMYQFGVRCTDCHDPHTGMPRARGNTLCTTCHGPHPDPRFPTLKAAMYDSPAHHFHRTGSLGAACVACHMPAKTYVVVDPRRDHSLQIPRPDLSVKLGTPNACTGCHADKSPRWAAAAMRRWYGPAASPGVRYTEALAAGRDGARVAEADLSALATDIGQPAILRATALDLLQRLGTAGIPAALRALADSDPVVRAAAVAGLDRLPVDDRVGPVTPLLEDPVRAVRIEAARVLAPVPPERFTPPERRRLDAALAELTGSQRAMTDMPSAHVAMAALHESRGQRDLAEKSYQTALQMDPYLVPARTNLARLYEAQGQLSNAESILREGIRRTPASGELYYALGLLLAEEQRLVEAAGELADAVRLLPRRARVRYNYGVVLQHLGRPAAATALLEAHRLDPRDPQPVYALAIYYLERRDYARAAIYAKRLAELTPTDAGARQLLDRVRRSGDGKRE